MELDTEKKNHTRHGLHVKKLGKSWLSHKITKLIYATLDVKMEPTEKTEDEQEPKENIKEAEVNDSSHECMDNNKKEDVRMKTQTKTQMEMVNNNTEMLIQETDERVSGISVNKQVDDSQDLSHEYMADNEKEDTRMKTQIKVVNKNTEMLFQDSDERVSVNSVSKKENDRDSLNNVSMIMQNQENVDKEKNDEIRNNSMDPEVEQASSTITRCKILHKIFDTRRISTRSKKPPSMRDNDNFLW
jgi:DNA polymerase III alpha subunit (gram-positive type)